MGRSVFLIPRLCVALPLLSLYHLGARRSIGVIDASQKFVVVGQGLCRSLQLLRFAAALPSKTVEVGRELGRGPRTKGYAAARYDV